MKVSAVITPSSNSDPDTAADRVAVSGVARIGVIIPVYNRPRIILDAMSCVVGQTRTPHRLVIVDDGSTDDTAANIERALHDLSPPFETRLIRQSRGGVSAARNRAASALEDCDVLAMIDSDDLWPDDYLEKMVPPLESDRTVAATFCDQAFVNTRDGSVRERDLSIYVSDTTRRMFLYGPPTPSCTVIRASLFRKLGGYDQSLTCSEDYDLHLKLSLEGRWVHVAGPKVQIRRATGVDRESAHHLTELKDVRLRVARVRMLERFARDLGGGRAMPWRAWRTGLAEQWGRLGDELCEASAVAEAAWCYRRAVAAAPWSLRKLKAYLCTRCVQRPKAPLDHLAATEAAV